MLVTLIQTFVERIYITDENDERNCHIFIKGCSKEDYDDFFRATGYVENTQETGAVTTVLPVCDSDECGKKYIGMQKEKRTRESASCVLSGMRENLLMNPGTGLAGDTVLGLLQQRD